MTYFHRLTEGQAAKFIEGGKQVTCLGDGSGLYLRRGRRGTVYFTFRYQWPRGGAWKETSLGLASQISLSFARGLRDLAEAALRRGRDPAVVVGPQVRRKIRQEAPTECETTPP